MEIEQHVWGFTPEGGAVVLYTMRNAVGATVRLTNLGAAVVAVEVPDREGRIADVALGYDRFESYINDDPYFGKTVGRYANRMGRARFTLDGAEYRLSRNAGRHQLHGGADNFSSRLWTGRVETDRVVFSLTSPSGDQGYPGELGVEVCYDWSDANELEITFYGASDAPTVVNLTNHTYFNLAGEGSGSVLGHLLQLNASRYLETDEDQIPTGTLVSVAGTPMDFRAPKPLGREIGADYPALKTGHGYDHCWVADGWREGETGYVGSLSDPVSGRVMRIHSTQPAVQVYTGNWLAGAPPGKGGRAYDDRDGVALECQGFPDAPNHPHFPSQRLDPGVHYFQKIIFTFTVD